VEGFPGRSFGGYDLRSRVLRLLPLPWLMARLVDEPVQVGNLPGRPLLVHLADVRDGAPVAGVHQGN
jgi:hypothetical protein